MMRLLYRGHLFLDNYQGKSNIFDYLADIKSKPNC